AQLPNLKGLSNHRARRSQCLGQRARCCSRTHPGMDGVEGKSQKPKPQAKTNSKPSSPKSVSRKITCWTCTFFDCSGRSHGYIHSMTRQQVLDLYFMDARSKLIDLAAFLDRVERAEGKEDFRLAAFREALKELENGSSERAKAVLVSFSDPTAQPIEAATTKAACGAWPG